MVDLPNGGFSILGKVFGNARDNVTGIDSSLSGVKNALWYFANHEDLKIKDGESSPVLKFMQTALDLEANGLSSQQLLDAVNDLTKDKKDIPQIKEISELNGKHLWAVVEKLDVTKKIINSSSQKKPTPEQIAMTDVMIAGLDVIDIKSMALPRNGIKGAMESVPRNASATSVPAQTVGSAATAGAKPLDAATKAKLDKLELALKTVPAGMIASGGKSELLGFMKVGLAQVMGKSAAKTDQAFVEMVNEYAKIKNGPGILSVDDLSGMYLRELIKDMGAKNLLNSENTKALGKALGEINDPAVKAIGADLVGLKPWGAQAEVVQSYASLADEVSPIIKIPPTAFPEASNGDHFQLAPNAPKNAGFKPT